MAGRREILLIEIREDGARVVRRSIEDIGDAGTEATTQMDKLKAVLAGLVSAKVLKDVVMLADTYANMMNRLRVVTDSTWELHQAMEGVFEMSRETRTSMEANIDMFARVSINTKQMGLEFKDVLRFSKQLNHAIILSGVTAREAQWGMVQFSQALASNALRGDELRAILEQLPVVTDVIAAHFKVTRGELRDLGFQGLITADRIIMAFEEAERSLATRFGKRIPTIDQGITVLQSSILKLIGTVDQLWQLTTTLASGLIFVADNMEILGRTMAIIGTVIGVVLLKNLIGIVRELRLFNLALLVRHPWVTALIVGSAALVVFADKIKVATHSTATLKDVFTALGEKVKLAATVMRMAMAEAFEGPQIDASDVSTIWTILLEDVVKFGDDFLGIWKGIGAVIRWVWEDIPNHAKIAWNDLIDGIERVADVFFAVFKTISDVFSVMVLQIEAGILHLHSALMFSQAGMFSESRKAMNQAKASFAELIATDFSQFGKNLTKNLAAGMKEDLLAGVKFKIEDAGGEAADIFAAAFNSSGFIAGLFGRAKEIAGAREAGGPTETELGSLPRTPMEGQLYKDLTGDIGRLKAETQALSDLMMKQAYVAIILVTKAWRDGEITQAEYESQLATQTTTMLSYVDSVTELDMLLQRGRITQDQYNMSIDVVKERMQAIVDEFDNVTVSVEAYLNKLEELRLKALGVSRDMGTGFERGFKKVGLEITNFANQAEKVVVNAFSGMEDAIVKFVQTGKLDFKSMVDGMLADLTRLILRLMLVKALEGAAGGGGLGGTLASAFGITAKADTTTKKALGGSVSPGMPILVGERGPEIFRPAQPGHITPNNQIAQQQQPAQEVPITIINVATEEAALSAMGSAEGKRVIRNEIRAANSGR